MHNTKEEAGNQRAKKSSYGQGKQEQQRTSHKESPIFSCAICQKSTSTTFQLLSVNMGYAVISFTMLIKLHASVVAFKNGLSVLFLLFFLFSTGLHFYLRRGEGRGDVCIVIARHVFMFHNPVPSFLVQQS